MFQTNYNHDVCAPVPVSEELITEQTGYRTTKEIVEGMILAGRRLNDYRHGLLDNFDEEYDESQEAGLIYENDPVELQSAAERLYMRYRGKKEEVTDEKGEKIGVPKGSEESNEGHGTLDSDNSGSKKKSGDTEES